MSITVKIPVHKVEIDDNRISGKALYDGLFDINEPIVKIIEDVEGNKDAYVSCDTSEYQTDVHFDISNFNNFFRNNDDLVTDLNNVITIDFVSEDRDFIKNSITFGGCTEKSESCHNETVLFDTDDQNMIFYYVPFCGMGLTNAHIHWILVNVEMEQNPINGDNLSPL